MATCECNIAIIEMDNHLQALNIKERKVTVEPTKDLEEIFLMMIQLSFFLKNNRDVFIWSYEDM